MLDSYLVLIYREYLYPDTPFEVRVFSDGWVELYSITGGFPVCFNKCFRKISY